MGQLLSSRRMIFDKKEEIVRFCLSEPIQRLRLFGSFLHGTEHKDSDIDLLVEYQRDAEITLFDLVEDESKLSAILGKRVDLRTPEELSEYFRERVLGEAEVLFER
jgi:predicted nucleotidyltransferase